MSVLFELSNVVPAQPTGTNFPTIKLVFPLASVLPKQQGAKHTAAVSVQRRC